VELFALDVIVTSIAALSVWFWLFFLAEVVVLFIFNSYSRNWLAAVSLIVFFCIVQWGFGYGVLGYVRHNPLRVGIGIMAYLAFGVGWATWMWIKLCKEYTAHINDTKDKFFSDTKFRNRVARIVDDKRPVEQLWAEYMHSQHWDQALPVGKHKSELMLWMEIWPVSFTWNAIDDFVVGTFRWLYKTCVNFWQNISNNIYNKAIGVH